MYNNMRELLEDTCNKFSDNVAFLLDEGNSYRSITYNKLMRDVYNLAGFLQKNNFTSEKIAVIGKNSYEWLVVYFATLTSGGVIVPFDNGLFKEEVFVQLNRSEAKTVFCSKKHFEYLSETNLNVFCTEDDDFFDKIGNNDYLKCDIDSEGMSVLLFTSGTTESSKAVMLSQCNIIFDACAMKEWEIFYQSDVSVAVLPFHHTFGMLEVILFLMFGMKNVIVGSVMRFPKAMVDCKVTGLVAVPRIHDMIKDRIMKTIKEQNKLKKFNAAVRISTVLLKLGIDIRPMLFKDILNQLGNLRIIVSGAAAANEETLSFFKSIGILAISGYGLTETSPCISAESENCIRQGSVGKTIPGVKIRIDDMDENGIGEIVVSGKNVMLGYYKNEEENKKVFDGEWFKTGDLGYIDKDGFIFITGRKKYVIVLSNGKNVFPEELEYLIEKSDAVKESIVYKDKETDKLYAKIVYQNYKEEEAEKIIKKHISEINKGLISYKQIRDFSITDKEFEKTTTLKIKRNKV